MKRGLRIVFVSAASLIGFAVMSSLGALLLRRKILKG
jgi:hypothetical protein